MIPTERYTLVLRHEYVDEDGNRHELDKPITVSHIITIHPSGMRSVVINDMVERMRIYLLQTIEGEE